MSIRAMMIGGASAVKPDAPTGASASVSSFGVASVSFSAPANNGGSAITGYTVTSNTGYTGSGSSSPVTVSGLPTGSHTFTVTATNAVGTSDASSPSNSITFVSAGQQTLSEGQTFTVPAGVFSVSYVLIGGGGFNNTTFGSVAAAASGGGGGLSYYNNYPVSPGQTYTHTNDGFSHNFIASTSQRGAPVGQGTNPTAGGVGQSYSGGNAGGWASTYAPQTSPTPGGGGGAAGYAGNGAPGGGTIAPAPSGAGSSGQNSRNNPGGQTGGGGGVGVQGFAASRQYMGGGASYGTDGTNGGYGGNYGGGAGGAGARWDYDADFGFSGGPSPGIARVMWNATGGSPRTYPSSATDV
jgi:hypothetical protein